MKKLYPASEIAEMRLPGLPTTKARVIERAKSEGWSFEEEKGRGGTRRLYEVPQKYLEGEQRVIDPTAGSSHFLVAALESLAARRAEEEAAKDGALKVEEPLASYGPPRPPGGGSAPATIAGGVIADPELLTIAIRAFEEWCAERKMYVPPERKASVIAVLYDYLAKGAGVQEVDRFLRIVG